MAALVCAGCASDPDRLAFDTEVWFALGPIGWSRVALMLGCLASVAAVAALFGLASVRMLVDRTEPIRDRLIGLALGALAVVAAVALIRGYAVATLAPVLGWDDDFAVIRVEDDDLLLIPGTGPAQRRRARDLVSAELRCRVTAVSGDEGWACEREVLLRWTNGDVTRTRDHVEWGLSRCTGALDDHLAHLNRLLSMAGAPAALRVVGDCPVSPQG